MKWIVPAVLVAGLAVWLARRSAPSWEPEDDQPDQLPDVLEEITVSLTPSTYTRATVSAGTAAANERAFLDMIAFAEGTTGSEGYRAMFGYPRPDRLCENLADHPRIRFPFTNKLGQQLYTTAAGRYQFLARTWDALRAQLDLPDFGPDSQDSAALELVRQRGALNDVRAGRLKDAVTKCAPIWASLPGAGYAQPERKFSQLATAYQANGGTLEA